MRPRRRQVLKAALIAAGAILLGGRRADAAEWPKDAFTAGNVADALMSLYGSRKPIASKQITIRSPHVSSDGARVPFTVSSTLKRVRSMSIFVEKNPQPLSAFLDLRGAIPYFSTDLKLVGSSDVLCVVDVSGTLYYAKRRINITLGATQK
jgi:sulfur-oxidizing protein SoxY